MLLWPHVTLKNARSDSVNIYNILIGIDRLIGIFLTAGTKYRRTRLLKAAARIARSLADGQICDDQNVNKQT